jgi:hypothetical protein
MPTREEICTFVRALLQRWIEAGHDIWVSLYLLLLDYSYDVPRITDSNRLKHGIWRGRAQHVEQELATALQCETKDVQNQVDVFMREFYPTGTQRMNPIGIAFACAVVYFIQRFSRGNYEWKIEARIGIDVFPNLTNFRRRRVDIVVFQDGEPYAVISSKWGIRHDRVRDPQEEADTYKQQVPSLKFYVVTNEFDRARLQKVLAYPSIDGVFHVRRDLVWQVYGGVTGPLANLKDLTDFFALFP